ncbi:RNA helicase BRR2, DEAD-box superfamily [Trachipleistophora hominis]|uniref:RNA helicase BRR2, DEAD-box superfamily n=1 Tax=Trachipleistophora hominis TaxID=72359 RepID=L7JZI1_TRAHO|nr:RNA helicase BRR2, DEAD-box superfamily [Trachipleistophora hominis]
MEFNLFHLIRLLSPEQIKAYIKDSEVPPNLPLYLTQQLKDNYVAYRNIFAKLNCEETDLYQRVTLHAGESSSFKLRIRNKMLKRMLGGNFYLNVCQAAALEFINAECNVVICSPTGSGKTVMALFFILRALGYDIATEDGGNADEQPHAKQTDKPSNHTRTAEKTRIVYLSPLKSLCSQIFSFFADKLSRLINVSIATSDDSLTRSQLMESNLIISTPEKFDSILRKYVLPVDLLIIDEIHVLNSDRGAVLETMISRMIGTCRMLGMSATIPNLKDICRFLKAKAVHFDSSYRSVPLQMNLINIRNHEGAVVLARNNLSVLERLLNEIEGNTIVFIRRRAEVEECCAVFSKHSTYKCLYHHAGLSKSKRTSVESSFMLDDSRKVLFSTSTLAWGVNLPADNVIIFDDFTDYDIVQMMGRAGREKYHKPENVAKAFLITSNVDRLDLICNLKPIRSRVKHLEDVYLANLFLRSEQAFENTLYFLERAGQIAKNVREEDWCLEGNQQYGKKDTAARITTKCETRVLDGCSDRETESLRKRHKSDEAVTKLHEHVDKTKCRNDDYNRAMIPKENTKNNITIQNSTYSRKYHMFNEVIRNLCDHQLIFLNNGVFVLSKVAQIAVIYTIHYKTAMRYFEQIRNFRTEEEIFLILNDVEINGTYTTQHLFPTDTMVGKYVQYCILKHKRINDTIRVILRQLRALLYLSNEKGTVRGSKLILRLLLMIENNVNTRKEDSVSTENEDHSFEDVKVDGSIFKSKRPAKEYHLFVSDPLDNTLVCYRKMKNKNLDFLDLHGVFLVCFTGTNGCEESKIITFGLNDEKCSANYESHQNLRPEIEDAARKDGLINTVKPKQLPYIEQKRMDKQVLRCLSVYNRKLTIVDNDVMDCCSSLIIYRHYFVKYNGKGILIFAHRNAYSFFHKNDLNMQCYYIVDYLQSNDTDEYDWCYIIGTDLNEYDGTEPELYCLDILFFINSRTFYVLGSGLNTKTCAVSALENLKKRFSITNTFSLSMIEALKKHFICLKEETTGENVQ